MINVFLLETGFLHVVKGVLKLLGSVYVEQVKPIFNRLVASIGGVDVPYRFRAPYDDLVKSITLAIVVGLLALACLMIYLALSGFPSIAVLMLALVAGVIVGPYLFAPKGFELTLEGVVVRRIVRSFTIPYSELVDVERVKWTWKALRLGASGGLYGFFGYFYVAGLGKVWMYVTSRDKMVLLKTRSGSQYAISPEKPEEFIHRLKVIVNHL